MCYVFLSEIKNAFPVFTNLGPLITAQCSLTDPVAVTEINRRKGTYHILLALYSNQKCECKI